MSEPTARAPTAVGAIGNRSLHVCMTGLVALNLVFVLLTEAARPAWLAPLFVLTFASPLLARYKELFLYRALWNLGVIGFFVVLLRHALSADLAFVLEDGLILAVLCQVHLLNNLHANQRPDLLFINSYLIAIITAYITVDIAFSAAFLLYAPILLIGMQLLASSRPGRPLARDDLRLVLRDGLLRSAVVLGLSLLVFLFWPRDFQREAMFAKYLHFAQKDEHYEVGFSSSLELVQRDGVGSKATPALTVKLLSGRPEDVSPLWRGATLDRSKSGGAWAEGTFALPLTSPLADPVWATQGKRGGSRGDPKQEVARVHVLRLTGATQMMFMPRTALRFEIDPVHAGSTAQARCDAIVRCQRPARLGYELRLSADGAVIAGRPGEWQPPTAGELAPFVAVKPGPHIAVLTRLVQQLRRSIGDAAAVGEVANAYADFLRSGHAYRPPGHEGAAGSLLEFLTSDAGGHCEFFASALALMLRIDDIPARVVTGFRLPAFDAAARTWSVTSLDAHAWVEVYDGATGWFAIDATPAADASGNAPGLLARAQTALSRLWNKVTGFDAEARAAALQWCKAVPGRVIAAIRARPVVSLLAAGGLALLIGMLRVRRGRRRPPAAQRLRALLRRVQVEYAPAETPREILRRVEGMTEVSDEVRAAIRSAIGAHEAERYAAGADLGDAPRVEDNRASVRGAS